MRALNVLLVSSGFAALFFGIALVSALLTATIHSQLHSAKTPQITISN
jgi:hypothetical protein